MALVLTGVFRYNYLDSECVVYNINTAETLLLERQSATILQAIPSNSITVSQLEKCVATGIESNANSLSLDEVLNHLLAAGLIKNVA